MAKLGSRFWRANLFCRQNGYPSITHRRGAIAQLARAPPLQGGGPGFESLLLHQRKEASDDASFLWLCFGVPNPAQGPGEKCLWHFAKKSTLENYVFKDVVSGSPKVTRVPVAPPTCCTAK